MNNYNYAPFLDDAVQSVLDQLHEGDELIVVDDGSTDDSLSILEAKTPHPQLYVQRQPNSGQLAAVRAGINRASGDVILLLDSDDLYLPGYLQQLRKLYATHTDIDFIFSAPKIQGDQLEAVAAVQRFISGMQFTPGPVGPTRWGAQLFHEYVGVPTSGLSMKTSVAKRIATLPTSLDEMPPLNPLIARLIGVPYTHTKTTAPSADGVVVRAASLLGVNKFYNERESFLYRIHGGNKFAGMSWLAQRYVRKHRMRHFAKIANAHFALAPSPTTVELQSEIDARSYGLRLRRKLMVRARYAKSIATSNGTLVEKAGALLKCARLRQSS